MFCGWLCFGFGFDLYLLFLLGVLVVVNFVMIDLFMFVVDLWVRWVLIVKLGWLVGWFCVFGWVDCFIVYGVVVITRLVWFGCLLDWVGVLWFGVWLGVYLCVIGSLDVVDVVCGFGFVFGVVCFGLVVGWFGLVVLVVV